MRDQALAALLGERVRSKERPDGSTYPVLLLADAVALAAETALALGEVERFALAAGVVPERYSRNQKSLSCSEQLLLLRARVAIIGLGGLGGAVVEMLSRLGIGHLTMVDGDVFDESNLNRQLLSSPKLLGCRKAEVAAARVAEINAAVTTRTITHFLGADNGSDILRDVDLAIDCLDNIPSRFILETACRHAAIPLVSAAIAGWSGQATVIFPGDAGLRRLYGPAEDAPRKGIEAALGTLPFAAVHLATVQCAAATSILLGRTSSLRHSLLLADLSDHHSEVVALDNPPELS